MGLWSRHIDAQLAQWSAGDLGAPGSRKMLEHAKCCSRCGGLLNRVLLAHRVFQGSLIKPSEEELSLWACRAAAVAAASAPRESRAWNRSWLMALAGAAVASLLVLIVWPQTTLPPEFAVRGDGVPHPAVLRIYCAAPGGDLEELVVGGKASCTAGSILGFAVGVQRPLRQVRLTVSLGGKTLAQKDFAVTGLPGNEEAVELTVAPGAGAGPVHVEAAFSETVAGLDGSKVRLARDVPVEGR
ncbi:MAG: hypothetical protein HY901_07590 [Deltaproteobacteria bacterium]|nr:hypothetical protein [Deltaproteobacteria bacterium]